MEKINLTNEQIKEIASELDIGMNVYVNKVTKEIKSIINFDHHIYADEELWEDEINEIEKNFDSYIQFEPMDSRQAFRVMEEFVETLDNSEIRKKLELGLSLSKPFRNFKDILENYLEYRDKWFSFKEKEYIEYVKEQLDDYNNTEKYFKRL